MRRFSKGDKVLAPYISRSLPIAEVEEVYDAVDGSQVLLCKYQKYQETSVFYRATDVEYIGDRRFLVSGSQIYRISNGEIVAESKNWARVLADFLETFEPAFPGHNVQTPASQTHDDWHALNE